MKNCDIAKDKSDKIAALYLDSLVKKLLQCWEIEQRLTAEFEKAVSSYKPPAPGAAVVHLPHVPRLEDECQNFLYAAKNYLRDLLQVFNLLHDTKFDEASEWVPHPKGAKSSVMEYSATTFGETHVNTRFFRQLPACIAPFISMRNAVEHPEGYSGALKIDDIAFGPNGSLVPPKWKRVKDGKTEYGPLNVLDDMRVALHNLLIMGEDVLIMWAITHLAVPAAMAVTIIAEPNRNPLSPIKYRVGPSDTILKAVSESQRRKP